MSINHLFENKIVFSNEKRNIDPTSLLNFTISTVSDNSYYNLYDSYLVLDLEGKVSKSSDVVSAANQSFRIKTNFQPSGMISAGKANYSRLTEFMNKIVVFLKMPIILVVVLFLIILYILDVIHKETIQVLSLLKFVFLIEKLFKLLIPKVLSISKALKSH